MSYLAETIRLPKRLFQLLVLGSLVLGLGTGCILETTSSEVTTCSLYDDFLYNCTANCSPTWDCERNYATLHPEDQYILDACSDCLVANVDEGWCDDCSVPEYGIRSCQWFMEDFLGVTCW